MTFNFTIESKPSSNALKFINEFRNSLSIRYENVFDGLRQHSDCQLKIKTLDTSSIYF